jgi:uncharacterized repeat protein (TIGR03803 family)
MARPLAMVLQDDTLYGSTAAGGSLANGTVFKVRTNGQDYTVLKEFDGFTEGGSPEGTLVLSGNTLYGTTYTGGRFDQGTVFKVNIDGSGFAVLKEFTGPEGGHPGGGLALADSTLCGATIEGGGLNAGVLFRLSLLPSLRIERSGLNAILVAWPHPSEGFLLQQNSNLGPAGWTSAGTPPVQVGGEWQVSISPATGNRFFRLHKP